MVLKPSAFQWTVRKQAWQTHLLLQPRQDNALVKHRVFFGQGNMVLLNYGRQCITLTTVCKFSRF